MKPKCKLIGEDGNIFNLCAVASRALKEAGLRDKVMEMQNKVIKSKSYDEALLVLGDYVEIE